MVLEILGFFRSIKATGRQIAKEQLIRYNDARIHIP